MLGICTLSVRGAQKGYARGVRPWVEGTRLGIVTCGCLGLGGGHSAHFRNMWVFPFELFRLQNKC
jgi:hypothetical protein